jgi:hypothetical protein
MNSSREEHIRRVLLLELNNAFSNTYRYCEREGEDCDREFLDKLVEEVKECVRGGPQSTAEPNELD